jgi:hypothetical protein
MYLRTTGQYHVDWTEAAQNIDKQDFRVKNVNIANNNLYLIWVIALIL